MRGKIFNLTFILMIIGQYINNNELSKVRDIPTTQIVTMQKPKNNIEYFSLN